MSTRDRTGVLRQFSVGGRIGAWAAVLAMAGVGCTADAPSGRALGQLAPSEMPAAPLRDAAVSAAKPPAGAEAAGVPAAGAVAAVDRQIIYTATLQIVVPDIASALAKLQQTAQTMGGYLDRLSGDSLSLRVPAKQFAKLVAAAEALGAVTQRDIRAQDITEEMYDLQIRLDTELQVRQRLLTLLEKADKTESAIKVEQELERVVQTIEQLKGKIRFYQDQLAFSTLLVKFNSPVPQAVIEQEVPIPWVRELAGGMTRQNPMPYVSRDQAKGGPKFELPSSYIRSYGRGDLAMAMSADEVYVRVERHENYQGGDLKFWSTLARRVLVARGSIAIEKESELTLKTGAKAQVIRGTRQIGAKHYGYLLMLVSRKREVYALEAWGPAEAFAQNLPALEQMAASLEVDP